MGQYTITNKELVELVQEMIETGYMKHEIQEHLLDIGVSFAIAHETVENLYRYNANTKCSYLTGRTKRRFWRLASNRAS